MKKPPHVIANEARDLLFVSFQQETARRAAGLATLSMTIVVFQQPVKVFKISRKVPKAKTKFSETIFPLQNSGAETGSERGAGARWLPEGAGEMCPAGRVVPKTGTRYTVDVRVIARSTLTRFIQGLAGHPEQRGFTSLVRRNGAVRRR
jgi:hypothetical protein